MSLQISQLRFSDFYEKWVGELEGMLHQLLRALERPQRGDDQSELQALVEKARGVYAEYYVQKWRRLKVGNDDILSFFSPTWLSPLEKSKYWVTGWKPSSAFRLLDTLMHQKNNRKAAASEMLDEDQKMKIIELRKKVRAEEEAVEREIGSTQLSLADRTVLELAEFGCVCEGRMVEEAVSRLLGELENVMKAADGLRLMTVEGVLGILSTRQSVEFLAAACMLQIQMRKWGRRTQIRKGQ